MSLPYNRLLNNPVLVGAIGEVGIKHLEKAKMKCEMYELKMILGTYVI